MPNFPLYAICFLWRDLIIHEVLIVVNVEILKKT
jgi:hypothetical protein